MDSKIKKETIEWLKERAICGESQRAQTILNYIFELESELKRVKDESPHEDSDDNFDGYVEPLNANSALFNKYGG